MQGPSAWIGWVVALIIVLGALRGMRFNFLYPSEGLGSGNSKKDRRKRKAAALTKDIFLILVALTVYSILKATGVM